MNFSLSFLEQQRLLDKHNDMTNFTDGRVKHPLHELTGQTVGLIGGAGRIGTAVAHVCLALGMNVIISSRRPTLPDGHSLLSSPYYDNVHVQPGPAVDVEEENGQQRRRRQQQQTRKPNVTVVQDIDRDLLPHCDYVSLHAPLNDETRGSFGRAQIERMKPTSYLINTSRGAVIREDELIGCMEDNMIAGAGLDVQSSEPPTIDSKLWTLPNVFLSPHIGWRRIETRQRLVDMTCDNIRSYIDAKANSDSTSSVVADGCINVVS